MYVNYCCGDIIWGLGGVTGGHEMRSEDMRTIRFARSHMQVLCTISRFNGLPWFEYDEICIPSCD